MLDCLHRAPTSTMVSGPSEHIAKVSIDVKDQAISCTLLNIPYALHRGQMDRILPHFEALPVGRCFPKRYTVASLLRETTVANEGVLSASYLNRQARELLNFRKALEA